MCVFLTRGDGKRLQPRTRIRNILDATSTSPAAFVMALRGGRQLFLSFPNIGAGVFLVARSRRFGVRIRKGMCR